MMSLDLPCEKEVDLVKQRILEVRPRVPGIPDEWVREFLTDGKYVRSRLIFLSYYASGGEVITDGLVDAAASIELIHAASLVHDDILDDAETRRGLLSAPVLIGDPLSILLGDALFTEAFWLSSRLGPEVADLSHKAVREMVQGEAREMVNETGQWSPNEAQEVAREKTASVMGAACGIGAQMAGRPEIVEDLERFGLLVGVAFQAVDDALDVSGQGDATGKPTGIDARMGAPNLAQALGETGAEQARQLAKEWISQAHGCLEVLDPSEERDQLRALADFIVSRDV